MIKFLHEVQIDLTHPNDEAGEHVTIKETFFPGDTLEAELTEMREFDADFQTPGGEMILGLARNLFTII